MASLNESYSFDTVIQLNPDYILNALQNLAILTPAVFINGIVLFVCLRKNKMPPRFKLIVLGTTVCNFTGLFFAFLFMIYYLHHFLTGQSTTFLVCGLLRRCATYMSIPSMNIVIVTSIDRYLYICRNIRVPNARIIAAYIALHVAAVASVLVHVLYGGVSHEFSCGPTISGPPYFHIVTSVVWLGSIVVAFAFAWKTMIYLFNYERADKISGNFLRSGSWKEVLGRRPTIKRRIGQREVHVQKSIIMGIFLQGVIPLFTAALAATMIVNVFHIGRKISQPTLMAFSALYYLHFTLIPVLQITFGRPLRQAVISCFKMGYSKLPMSSATNRSPPVSV